MEVEKIDLSGGGLFVVFRVCDNLFVLPGEYISDIGSVDDITAVSHISELFMTFLSYRRAVTSLSLKTLFVLDGEHSEEKILLLLQGTPITALLVNEIVAVEKTEKFVEQSNFTFTNDLIDKLYIFTDTGEIVMRLNMRTIMDLFGKDTLKS